jgi:RNA polymerase sigma-70 factor (ECF subfamily)
LSELRRAKISELASLYGKLVFHSANRLLADAHCAEDITQDVFLKLFSTPDTSFNNIQNWPGYLKSMAIFAAIDFMRKQKRHAESSLELNVEPMGCTEQQPWQKLLTQLDMNKFLSILLQLKPQDANAFCLRFVEGYSYQEIGELLDISANSVGVKIHRSQQQILAQLGQSQSLGDRHAV